MTSSHRIALSDPSTRACGHCGNALVQRSNERERHFLQRRNCNQKCAGMASAKAAASAGTRRGPLPRPAIDRFDGLLIPEPNSGCWLWIGNLRRGYGLFNLNGRTMGAHRAAYILHRGDIPPGLYVLHRCDVRQCVNPDHLFLGTHTDNMADMVQKGRSRRGEKNPSAKLTAATASQAKDLYLSGVSMKRVAAQFGVSRRMIGKIVDGLAWQP